MSKPWNKTTVGILYVLAASTLWGTTGTSQALAPVGAESAVIGAVRVAIGGITLMAIALLRDCFKGTRTWPIQATIISSLFVAAYQVFFFSGVALTGVAAGTMVAIGSSPVAAGILGYLIRHERVNLRWMISTLLAIVGCALLSIGGALHTSTIGIILSLGAGFSFAAYTVSIKSLLDYHDPNAVVAVVFCLAGLILSPLFFTYDVGWLTEPRGIAVAFNLGVMATAVSYMFYARGLKYLKVGTAATLSLGEPLTATILGVVVLGENMTLPQIAGIILLFSGLVLLALGQKRNTSQP